MEDVKIPTLEALQTFEESNRQIKQLITSQQMLIVDCSLRIEKQAKSIDESSRKLLDCKKRLLRSNRRVLELEQILGRLSENKDKIEKENEALQYNVDVLSEEEKRLKRDNEQLAAEKDFCKNERNAHYESIRQKQLNICRNVEIIMSNIYCAVFDEKFIQSRFNILNIEKVGLERAIEYIAEGILVEMAIDEFESVDFSKKIYDWIVGNVEVFSKLFRLNIYCRIDSIASDLSAIIDVESYRNSIELFISSLIDLNIEIKYPIPFFDKYIPEKYDLSHHSDISQINANYTNSVIHGKVTEIIRIGVRYADSYIKPIVTRKV